jgi:exodeoxyribonuclease V beta subunit
VRTEELTLIPRGLKTPGFDLLNSPLEGTNLIEAGAGTGKTYTLAGLFLRLILERRLRVNEILVVTYTVAATEELRDRIRRKIREALEACSAGTSPDSFLQSLLLTVPDREEAAVLLHAALLDFDEAAIFTIHGFCQRTLQESAFESGSLFDTELEPEEESGLIAEIVQDFWRRHFYDAPREWVQYALSLNLSPATFLELLKKGRSQPDLKIIPRTDPVFFTTLEPFRRVYAELRNAWPEAREEVEQAFSDPALTADYTDRVSATLGLMDVFLEENSPAFPLPEKFEKFTTRGLEKKTRKNLKTPRHSYFLLCDALQLAAGALRLEMDRHLLYLKGAVFQVLGQELPIRKQWRNIQSFDDLLIRLRRSLEKAGGDELSREVRRRYRAALIDEFQDTDPVQYAIFQNIFGKGGSILFLIGDPKQAIYSFRGADLFAYLKASGRVDRRYTLDRNWRSEPGLIAAVNTVFGSRENAFLFREIPFEPAVAEEGGTHALLAIRGKMESPLHFWLVDSGDGGLINKGEAEALIPGAVAGEISRLLRLGKKGEALLDSRRLREGDLAVLVRTNRQARLMQTALGRLNIASVLHTTGNLFDSYEAQEMQRVLDGMVHPLREGRIRAALTTNLLGVTGETLERLSRDEAGWEEWLSRFREYYEIGERKGFIRMFRYFLLREKVRSRLLGLPDGERRLTNVLHLSEVLHQRAVEEKLGLTGLLKWLVRQGDPGSPRLEEHQLRLESDAEAVKIVTIHRSKGLEYPIVFCPFNWDPSKIKKGAFTFHDREDDWRLNLVLDPKAGGDRDLAELAAEEELAENLRLLYVSLTRAKNRCYLIWGRFRDAETSSLAYLLAPPGDADENIVQKVGTHFQSKTDGMLRQDLDGLARKSKGMIRVTDLPRAPGEEVSPGEKDWEELSGRVFRGPVSRDWQIASFSRLTVGVKETFDSPPSEDASADLPDHDQALAAEEPLLDPEPFSIFAFPRGAKAGTLLHDLLEDLDFSETDPLVIKKLVADKLAEYGFDSKWQETVVGLIGRVLKAPLPSPSGSFTLAQISRAERLNELEFNLPLQRVTPRGLAKIFADHGGAGMSAGFPARLENLDFQPARGFMKGFIDLVFQFQGRFYLVDWKSNFLGARVQDYHRENLVRAMEDHFYRLQLNLYVLALHRYLKYRLPGYRYAEHFGGAFYLFLRGLNPGEEKGFGIYSESPREGLIEVLSQSLIGAEASS